MKLLPETWEELAALIIRQTVGLSGPADFKFGDAYRAVDENDLSYVDTLANVSGWGIKPGITAQASGSMFDEPRFDEIPTTDDGGIILAPFALKKELDLPDTVWRGVAKHLRTYGQRVFLMGPKGKRADGCAFTEAEILCNRPVEEKLLEIARAKLLVGVPNYELWAGTAWQKPLINLYPDHIPPRRWFWQARPQYGRMVYGQHELQLPIILAGLRKLVGVL